MSDSPRRSMTGYGRGVRQSADLVVRVELRSVNHRFLDLSVKLPRPWLAMESAIAERLRGRLGRGRVDVFVNREASGASGTVAKADVHLARSVLTAARELAASLHLPGELSLEQVVGFPGIVSFEAAAVDAEAEQPAVLGALDEAIEALVTMRAAEGARMAADVAAHVDAIEAITEDIAQRAEGAPAEHLQRLRARLTELLAETDLDEGRLEQEAATLADKAAVDEEIIRLRSHIAQARDLLADAEPCGRRLDFLVQEFLRETNTIGSKTPDPAVRRQVVELKSLIEKMKEQVANLE